MSPPGSRLFGFLGFSGKEYEQIPGFSRLFGGSKSFRPEDQCVEILKKSELLALFRRKTQKSISKKGSKVKVRSWGYRGEEPSDVSVGIYCIFAEIVREYFTRKILVGNFPLFV